jgi:acyl carrier protein
MTTGKAMRNLRTIVEELLMESGKKIPASFGSDTRVREDLGLNSLELAILTVRIESVYQVDVFEQGLVATLGGVAERIHAKHPGVTEEELFEVGSARAS